MSTAEAAPPISITHLATAFVTLARIQLALPAGSDERNHIVESRWTIMRTACAAYGEQAWAAAWTELARFDQLRDPKGSNG